MKILVFFLGFLGFFGASLRKKLKSENTKMHIGCKFPNRLELVLKSVPNRFEESSFARHANICIYGQGAFKYYVSMFEPDLGENILVD